MNNLTQLCLLFITVLTIFGYPQSKGVNVYFNSVIKFTGIGSKIHSITYFQKSANSNRKYTSSVNKGLEMDLTWDVGIDLQFYKTFSIGLHYSKLSLHADTYHNSLSHKISGFLLKPDIKYGFSLFDPVYLSFGAGIAFYQLELLEITNLNLVSREIGSYESSSEEINPIVFETEIGLKIKIFHPLFVTTSIGYSFSDQQSFVHREKSFAIQPDENHGFVLTIPERSINVDASYFNYAVGLQLMITL